ncbi:MAG: TIGR00159 family protein [Deltaproteobacteria bacterium]|nr:TIGR00159 family protein [Deltaproteobacteria bacterium]
MEWVSNIFLSYEASQAWTIITNVLDLLLVSWLIYRTMLLVKGTRAQPMLTGLIIIGFIYVISRSLDLVTLNWILGNFLGSVILVIVVLFQEDFRRALINVGLLRGFNTDVPIAMEEAITEVGIAVSSMAEKRIGALIVIARDIGLQDYVEHAVRIDAQVTHQLIESIFQHSSPIHDGAIIIQDGRIICAGAVLPLTFNPTISKRFGTRHRAAIGLSEHSDAITVVISEETGSISMIREGKIIKDLNEKTLVSALNRLIIIRQSRRKKLLARSFISSERLRTELKKKETLLVTESKDLDESVEQKTTE